MLTAHLPSGYIIGRLFEINRPHRQIIIAALIGAVMSRSGYVVFSFCGFRPHPSTHVCLALAPGLAGDRTACDCLVTFYWTNIFEKSGHGIFFVPACCTFASIALRHQFSWLMPFTQGRVELVSVPASYSHWILSYLLHWTFALELAIWLAAVLLHIKSKKTTLS